jgi:hypothetical protein
MSQSDNDEIKSADMTLAFRKMHNDGLLQGVPVQDLGISRTRFAPDLEGAHLDDQHLPLNLGQLFLCL